jgi:hypothetical protein
VQQEVMPTLPEIFLFPLSLSSGTGGEKEERERFPKVTSLPVTPDRNVCATLPSSRNPAPRPISHGKNKVGEQV